MIFPKKATGWGGRTFPLNDTMPLWPKIVVQLSCAAPWHYATPGGERTQRRGGDISPPLLPSIESWLVDTVDGVPSGKLTWQQKMDRTWRCIPYWKWGIFQPAMLVYQRVPKDVSSHPSGILGILFRFNPKKVLLMLLLPSIFCCWSFCMFFKMMEDDGRFPRTTVDGLEIPIPTTAWMVLTPCK